MSGSGEERPQRGLRVAENVIGQRRQNYAVAFGLRFGKLFTKFRDDRVQLGLRLCERHARLEPTDGL